MPTPGKADVVVTILVDRDGYEICFVEDAAFYDLATPLFDVVDFVERATRGGDGHALPEVAKDKSAVIADAQELDDVTDILASNDDKIVVLDFHASWCKNCKRIRPLLEDLASKYSSRVKIVGVDIDDSPDIGSSSLS